MGPSRRVCPQSLSFELLLWTVERSVRRSSRLSRESFNTCRRSKSSNVSCPAPKNGALLIWSAGALLPLFRESRPGKGVAFHASRLPRLLSAAERRAWTLTRNEHTTRKTVLSEFGVREPCSRFSGNYDPEKAWPFRNRAYARFGSASERRAGILTRNEHTTRKTLPPTYS